MAKIPPGADIYKPGPGQPKVADLISNRTILVQELNPKRAAASERIEVVDVPNLARAVKAFQPAAEFELNDTQISEGGTIEVIPATASMKYGEDKPQDVIGDFKAESLIGKVQRDGQSELECRLLLRQRLQSQVLQQVLERLNDPKFADAVNDPEKRKVILSTLDALIEKVENKIAEAQLR